MMVLIQNIVKSESKVECQFRVLKILQYPFLGVTENTPYAPGVEV